MQIDNKILTLDDIIKLSSLMHHNGFSGENITVSIGVKTLELLNKINEEIFYKNNKKNTENNAPQKVDEIVVNINGITFKYVLTDDTRGV